MNDTINRIDQIRSFCNTYFNHPILKDRPEKIIRIKGLSSGKKAVKILEADITLDNLSRMIPQILKFSDEGVNLYYALHHIQKGIDGKTPFNSSHVIQRLYYALDLDFKLPCSIGDIVEEFGLSPNIVISSSSVPHLKYHLLYRVESGLLDPNIKEFHLRMCRAFGSDNICDSPRILRLPGTFNWKPFGTGEVENSLCVLHTVNNDHTWPQEELEEYLSDFEKTALSRELIAISESSKVSKSAIGDREKKNNSGKEYFDYQYVLDRALTGEPTILGGNRHNALASWFGQMQNLTNLDIMRNMEVLRKSGCSPAYVGEEEDKDYYRLIGHLMESNEAEKNELVLESVSEEALKELETVPGRVVEIKSETLEPRVGASPLEQIESEQEAEEIRALESFVETFCDPIIKCDIEKLEDGSIIPYHVGRLIAAITHSKVEDLWMVDFFHKLFASHACASGNFYSGKAKVRTVWGDIAILKKPLTLGELGAVVQSAAMQLVQPRALGVINKLSTHGVVVKVLERAGVFGLVSSKGKKKNLAIRFPSNMTTINNVVSGLKMKAADSLGQVRWQSSSIIVFQNGIFDLRTGQFTEDKMAPLRHTNPIMAKYVEEGVGEEDFWTQFLLRAFKYKNEDGEWCDDRGSIELIYRIFAYCMTTDVSCRKIFVFKGGTRTGKSTLLTILAALIGKNNYSRGNFDNMATDFSFAGAEGRTAYFIEESQSKDHIKMNKVFVLLKEVTGTNEMLINEKHKAQKTIDVTFKPILTANANFEIRDPGGAIMERLVVIKTDNAVPDGEVRSHDWVLGQIFSEGAAHRIASEAARRLSAALIESKGVLSGVFNDCGSRALIEGNRDVGEEIAGAGGVLKSLIETGEEDIELPSRMVLAIQRQVCEQEGIHVPKHQAKENKVIIESLGGDDSRPRLPMQRLKQYRGFSGVRFKDLAFKMAIDWERVLADVQEESDAAYQASILILTAHGIEVSGVITEYKEGDINF